MTKKEAEWFLTVYEKTKNDPESVAMTVQAMQKGIADALNDEQEARAAAETALSLLLDAADFKKIPIERLEIIERAIKKNKMFSGTAYVAFIQKTLDQLQAKPEMQKQFVIERLLNILKEQFDGRGDSSGVIEVLRQKSPKEIMETDIYDEFSPDSIDIAELVMIIEDEFGIEFNDDETKIEKARLFGEWVDIIIDLINRRN